MSQLSFSLPAEFDLVAYTEQIQTWMIEGHSEQDILSQATFQWPTLSKSFIETTIQKCKSHKSTKVVSPIEPMHDLYIIHRKRSRQIRKIEARLDDEKAPVSLHTLYRGLLRDQEASCYKILALGREKEPASSGHEQTASKSPPLMSKQPDHNPAVNTGRPRFSVKLQSMKPAAILLCLVSLCFLPMISARPKATVPLHWASQPSILRQSIALLNENPADETEPFLTGVHPLPVTDSPPGVQRLASVSRPRTEWHRPGNGSAL